MARRLFTRQKQKFPIFDGKQERRDRKLAVLEVIEQLKDILFAPCNSGVTQQVRERAWGEVQQRAKSVHLISHRKNWTYVRDKLYTVWKARTMSKIAAVRTSGENLGVAAGLKKKFDEVDFKILDIICSSPSGDSYAQLEDQTDIQFIKETMHKAAQTLRTWEKVPRRKVIIAINKNFQHMKRTSALELARHEIFIRKLTALKLENEIELNNSIKN